MTTKKNTIMGLPWFSKVEQDIFKRMEYACVYAVGPVSGGPIKVTWGVHLPEKLAELQAGCWQELTYHDIAWVLDSGFAVRLKNGIIDFLGKAGIERLQGDWFDMTADQIVPVFQLAAQTMGMKTFTHAAMVDHIQTMRESRIQKELLRVHNGRDGGLG